MGGREIVHWAMSNSSLDLSSYSQDKVEPARQKIPGVLPWHLLCLESLCMKWDQPGIMNLLWPMCLGCVYSAQSIRSREARPVPATGVTGVPGPLVEHE